VAQLYPPELNSLYNVPYDSQGYGGGLQTGVNCSEEAEVTLRLTASQSVRGGIEPTMELATRY
jgi:hypothetical protein